MGVRRREGEEMNAVQRSTLTSASYLLCAPSSTPKYFVTMSGGRLSEVATSERLTKHVRMPLPRPSMRTTMRGIL